MQYKRNGGPSGPQTNTPPLALRLFGVVPGPMMVGIILLVALIAFELFNFDTTRFALASLLGEVRFAGMQWATILAIAFCAIDFAGLMRFFMPDDEDGRNTEYWYLTGAWLLGATMNAIMTWWAVSLTLLNHNLGNEVLTRGQLLEVVPIFVAGLVWLTRILFIGAFTVAGGYLFAGLGNGAGAHPRAVAAPQPVRMRRQTASVTRRGRQPQRAQQQPLRAQRQPAQASPTDERGLALQLPDIDVIPDFLVGEIGQEAETAVPVEASSERAVPQAAVPATGLRPQGTRTTRIRRRPPAPPSRRASIPMGAKGREGR